jgi:hypothetical protein
VLRGDPAIVVRLRLGEQVAGVGAVLARCLGIALLALACWPQTLGRCVPPKRV